LGGKVWQKWVRFAFFTYFEVCDLLVFGEILRFLADLKMGSFLQFGVRRKECKKEKGDPPSLKKLPSSSRLRRDKMARQIRLHFVSAFVKTSVFTAFQRDEPA